MYFKDIFKYLVLFIPAGFYYRNQAHGSARPESLGSQKLKSPSLWKWWAFASTRTQSCNTRSMSWCLLKMYPAIHKQGPDQDVSNSVLWEQMSKMSRPQNESSSMSGFGFIPWKITAGTIPIFPGAGIGAGATVLLCQKSLYQSRF